MQPVSTVASSSTTHTDTARSSGRFADYGILVPRGGSVRTRRLVDQHVEVEFGVVTDEFPSDPVCPSMQGKVEQVGVKCRRPHYLRDVLACGARRLAPGTEVRALCSSVDLAGQEPVVDRPVIANLIGAEQHAELHEAVLCEAHERVGPKRWGCRDRRKPPCPRHIDRAIRFTHPSLSREILVHVNERCLMVDEVPDVDSAACSARSSIFGVTVPSSPSVATGTWPPRRHSSHSATGRRWSS